MINQYEITYEQYKILYARYLDPKRTNKLLDLAGSLEGKNVIDLCGGGGRLSRKALKRGAEEVTLIDASATMTEHLNQWDISVFLNTIGQGLRLLPNEDTAAAFCQQGINYWFDRNTIELLSLKMKPGGVFIFNTFNNKPRSEPDVRRYTISGKTYVEIFWTQRIGDNDGFPTKVHHVQCVQGLPPHYNTFKWVSPTDFKRILKTCFNKVEVFIEGKTSTYRCTK